MHVDVDVVEPMGMETLVHFFVAGTAAVARVTPDAPARPGERLALHADMNNMHLVEPDGGSESRPGNGKVV